MSSFYFLFFLSETDTTIVLNVLPGERFSYMDNPCKLYKDKIFGKCIIHTDVLYSLIKDISMFLCKFRH